MCCLFGVSINVVLCSVWEKVEALGFINISDRKHVSSWEMMVLFYQSGWARLCCGVHLIDSNKIYVSVIFGVHFKSAGEVSSP